MGSITVTSWYIKTIEFGSFFLRYVVGKRLMCKKWCSFFTSLDCYLSVSSSCSFTFWARYNEHVVWNDKQLNLKLLRKGVLTRIYAPMVCNDADVKLLSVSMLFSAYMFVYIFFVRQLFKVYVNLVFSLLLLKLGNPLWMRCSHRRKSLSKARMLLDLEIYQELWMHLLGNYCKLLSRPYGILM